MDEHNIGISALLYYPGNSQVGTMCARNMQFLYNGEDGKAEKEGGKLEPDSQTQYGAGRGERDKDRVTRRPWVGPPIDAGRGSSPHPGPTQWTTAAVIRHLHRRSVPPAVIGVPCAVSGRDWCTVCCLRP